MNWSAIGAILMALSVISGAFGAHALKDRLDPYLMSVYEKAVFYQFLHSLAILIIPLFARSTVISRKAADRICAIFFLGILLFSGSLYALALSGTRILGVVTPFGGVAFIAGWLLLAYSLFKSSTQ